MPFAVPLRDHRQTMPLSGDPYSILNSITISARLIASHPNSEVKQVRAGVVLRWGTTQEGPVLRFFNGNLFSLDISAYVVY
jgi:hypothetical protein